MDISKILDFHRMVMMAAAQQSREDETSCGPLCQHPACWDSKRRKERGVPRMSSLKSKEEEEESDLPTMKYYNMLDDYGESTKDRYPARFGGRALHDRSSSMRNISQPLCSDSFGMTTAPYATPVSPDKASRSSLQGGLRMVEVQELFDQDDLNSCWDETFITRQYLVWVPNPNRRSLKKPLAITDREEGTKVVPKMLLPKDLTETMVPLHIQQEREDTIIFDEWPVLKKRQDRSRSPIFQKGTYPKTPVCSVKPEVDSEGVRELLSLPRHVLVQVLDRTKDSDFVSREKIHGIIQDVLDTVREGRSVHNGRDLCPPRTGKLHTSDMLLQQKAPLHFNKQRNIRDTHMLQQRPVFQLDDEDKSSSVDTARDVADASSTQGTFIKGTTAAAFPKFRKPLPAITGEDMAKTEDSPRVVGPKERKKIPSISLGLPELPRGLRHTRAFVYNSQHRPDFSLVPVPTPPESGRSSESEASEHGTTLRVNIPSLSDIHDHDHYAQPATGQRAMEEEGAMHVVSPALSTHVPKAPAGTPATFQSPTKMFRDLTGASSTLQGGDSRGLPPSREVTMSPGHKIWVPGTTSPHPAPSPDELGLSTINETAREQQGNSTIRSSQQRASRNVQFSEGVPAPPGQGTGRAQAGSPEDWPQVTEPTFHSAAGIMGSRSETAFITEHSTLAEHGSSVQRGRSDLNSRGSERSTLARRILDEGAKVESPAPPPPSPEPKEFGEKNAHRSKREDRSRESNAMEPLLEQSESECSVSPEKRMHGDKAGSQDPAAVQAQALEPVIQEEVTPNLPPSQDLATSDHPDPVSKVMVSHVAPRPSASREKLQQTFLNVDIPAEDMSSLHAEQGSTPMDITPSLTNSPGKTSPAKLSTPKSSDGPSSPTRKSSPQPSSPKKAKGRTGGKGKRDSGDGDAKKDSN